MDLEGIGLKPAEGKIAVRFVDDEEEEASESMAGTGPQPSQDEAVLAVVTGVGPKVTGVKKGDTVALRGWTRYSPKVGSITICDAYDVLGTIAG